MCPPGRNIHPQRHDSVPYAHLASFSIIGMAKPSLKSSLTYEYTQDTRDSLSIPTKVCDDVSLTILRNEAVRGQG